VPPDPGFFGRLRAIVPWPGDEIAKEFRQRSIRATVPRADHQQRHLGGNDSRLEFGSSFIGLVLVYAVTAILCCVWMLKGYFDTIPLQIEEFALMHGAPRQTVFFRIIVPLAKPAVAVTAVSSLMTGETSSFSRRRSLRKRAGARPPRA